MQKLQLNALLLFVRSISAGSFNLKEHSEDFRLQVNHSGGVKWQFGGVYSATCRMRIKKYPYDSQTCHVKIGNWGHDRYTSNLRLNGVGFSNLWEADSLWKIGEPPPRAQLINLGKYPQLVFTYTWQRQPRYYELNMVLPSALLLSVSCWVFWLPVESGEKIGLSMAALIAFSVFHSTVLQNTPMTSEEMPALGRCLCMLKNSAMFA